MKHRKMKHRKNYRSRQGGYTLAGVLLSLLISSAVLTAAAPRLRYWIMTPTITQTADHVGRFREAVDRYVRDNYASLAASAPVNGASVGVTVQQLRDSGYLPGAASNTNPYGQTYTVRIRHVLQGSAPNQRQVLEPMIFTTGGRAIPEQELRRVAGQVQSGGFISEIAPTVAKGAQGGWADVQVSSFGVNPGAGHLAVALFYDQAGTATEYLYRNSVAGRPEVNRMNTAIDMNAQNLANAGTITAQQATVAGNATVRGSLVLAAADGSRSGGWTMVDNTWIRSIGDKSIYTGGTVQATSVTGSTLYGTQVSGQTVSGTTISGTTVTGTTVAGSSVTAYGRLYANEYMQVAGVATAGYGCSPNGLLGRSAAGGVLSCENGIWRTPGGGLAQYAGSTCPAGMNVYGIYTSYRYKEGSTQVGWITNADMAAVYSRCTGSGDSGEYCMIVPVYTQWDHNVPSSVKCG